MKNLEEISTLIQPILTRLEVKLYDLKWRNENTTKILEVALISDVKIIDLTTCSTVSEEISQALDESDLISFAYYLDVCSAGAERRLRTTEELKEAIGKYVYVKLIEIVNNHHELIGYLREVNEETIVIDYQDKTRQKTQEISLENAKLIRLAVKV